ncbi:MAG: hypothetical protein J7L43_01495 [Candidatus Aenigmarchaeota archaeon]|nr:hypothetical protein [Candidatus Aenigmarchaeota archaeon]
MKGTSLPVNSIVIIALAVIVLVAIAVWFSSEMLHGQKQVNAEQAWVSACNQWKATNCDAGHFNNTLTGFPGISTIKEACKAARGSDDADLCKKLCCGE